MALTWKRVSSGLYRSNTFNSELWGAVQWWIRRDGGDYSLSLHRLNLPVSDPLVYEGGVDKIDTAKRRAARLMTDETVEAVGGLGATRTKWVQGDGGCFYSGDKHDPTSCHQEYINEGTGEVVMFTTSFHTRFELMPERVDDIESIKLLPEIHSMEHKGVWDDAQGCYVEPHSKLLHGVGQAGEGVLFYAATQGNRFEILAASEDDGSISLEEFKQGKSVGRSTGHNMVSARNELQRRIADARNIDGINYSVSVDNMQSGGSRPWPTSAAFAGPRRR